MTPVTCRCGKTHQLPDGISGEGITCDACGSDISISPAPTAGADRLEAPAGPKASPSRRRGYDGSYVKRAVARTGGAALCDYALGLSLVAVMCFVLGWVSILLPEANYLPCLWLVLAPLCCGGGLVCGTLGVASTLHLRRLPEPTDEALRAAYWNARRKTVRGVAALALSGAILLLWVALVLGMTQG